MDAFLWLRQGVLFLHLVSFAIALSAVLREDVAILLDRRIDAQRIAATARLLTAALAVLWMTGLALVACDFGLDAGAWFASPKLVAKLVVVSALTANGIALHAFAFPMLNGARTPERVGLLLPLVLGAFSTASWLYASFVGAARLVAPMLSFADFMALYAAVLTAAVAIAMLFVRPRLERLRPVEPVRGSEPRATQAAAVARDTL